MTYDATDMLQGMICEAEASATPAQVAIPAGEYTIRAPLVIGNHGKNRGCSLVGVGGTPKLTWAGPASIGRHMIDAHVKGQDLALQGLFYGIKNLWLDGQHKIGGINLDGWMYGAYAEDILLHQMRGVALRANDCYVSRFTNIHSYNSKGTLLDLIRCNASTVNGFCTMHHRPLVDGDAVIRVTKHTGLISIENTRFEAGCPSATQDRLEYPLISVHDTSGLTIRGLYYESGGQRVAIQLENVDCLDIAQVRAWNRGVPANQPQYFIEAVNCKRGRVANAYMWKAGTDERTAILHRVKSLTVILDEMTCGRTDAAGQKLVNDEV